MNSKERVLTTINHEEPDRVPVDIMIAPEVGEILIDTLCLDLESDPFALSKVLGNDILYGFLGFCDGFSSIYKEERKIEENLYKDQFGIKWRKKSHKYGSYCEFAEHPLANMKNYDSYKWPDPLVAEKEGIDMYKKIIDECGNEYAIIGSAACSILEASWYLRGLENLLMDLYLNKDFVIELFDKTMEYTLKISKKLVEMGVDIIWWGDDIAMEKGPLIDPKFYRELIKPRYAYMIQEVKKINKDVKIAYHTDGNIEWALDDIVEIGVEILNPLQPDANNFVEIKKKYGDKLTFWGNVDTRNIMINGNFVDVANEVKRVISILSPGGGHILCSNHTVQASPRAIDNTITYYWSARKFGNYPINIRTKEDIKKGRVYTF
jgi:uroporphyrinogen decarboxylase